MSPEEFRAALGREPSATDQQPGFYKWRRRRETPWRAVRIAYVDRSWIVFVNGEAIKSARDPGDIEFVRYYGPFRPITEAEYDVIVSDYQNAAAGSPLKTPDIPVNLRTTKPL